MASRLSRRYVVKLAAGAAIIVLVLFTLLHLFGPRPLTDVGDTQVSAGRPVPHSLGISEVNGFQEIPGLLSINLVIVPFLGYNTTYTTHPYNSTEKAILEREKEYKTVLQRNLNHNLVSCVHVLTTNASETQQRFKDLHNQDKLVVSEVKSIDLARDPFEFISRNLVGKDVIFANADIYLGGGFDLVDPLVMTREKTMYALSRQVALEERCGTPYPNNDKCQDQPYGGSHDVFLFRLLEPFPEQFLKDLEFDLVSPGMENIVIWLFQNRLKYCTLNPCTILETFHFHCSFVRNKKGKPRMNNRISGFSPYTKKLTCSS